MSFVKYLKCIICSGQQSIVDENFPEDLFDLITKYQIDQLVWLCRTCKTDYLQNSTLIVPTFVDKQNSEQAVISLNGKQEEKASSNKPQNNEMETSGNCNGKIDNLQSSSRNLPQCVKTSNKYVHEILNLIKIDPEVETKSKNMVQSIIKSLLSSLKEDEEFACMFQRFYYTGSSYNDLRITSASEFDINLVLKVPKNVNFTPVFHEECYAFGKLEWDTLNDDITRLHLKFLKDMSLANYLMPRMVSSWLQSLVDRILKQGSLKIPGVHNIKAIKSGPARTLIVESVLGYDISIDLVPVFEFDYSVFCGSSIFSELTKTEDKTKAVWFMVPKQCKGEIDGSCLDMEFYWRSDYPYAEKFILSGKECAKSVVKILKCFRDKKNWTALASYYLKMVVILDIVKNPDPEFWKNGNLHERVIDAFKQLRDYLRDRKLPHFLTKNNLLHKFNVDLCENWYNHLNKIIPLLESNPNNLIEQLQ